jgi:16S rRNA (cytosine1402-N4)-methyltransferase
MFHIPVMSLETSRYLIDKPDGLYVDCTFGGGGHTSYLLDKFKGIRIVAFDWDEDSLKRFIEREKEFGGRVAFIRDNFKNIKKALSALSINKVDGILADIGVSSKQFDDSNRGFSFNSGTLDMRMDKRNALTAKEVVNSYSYEDLSNIFYKYGEERRARQVASAVLLRRKKGVINTAAELQAVVCSVKRPKGRINPATKVFQALRIFVNSELENLEVLLSDAPELLNDGGRAVIISFHSLEDRIVKQNFKWNSECEIYKILTRKVVTALREEVKINPRSRSARIRAAERISV